MRVKELQVRFRSQQVNQIIKPLIQGILAVALTAACSDQTAKDLTTGQNQHNPEASSSPTQCQSIPHALGETEVCGQPKKIVALGPNILEILLALEVQPIGYADYFSLTNQNLDQPSQQILYLGKQMTSQPSNVGTWIDPSLEAIAKLQPDLILGSKGANQDEYTLLSKIAPTLLFTYYEADKGWQPSFRSIARVLGRSEQAEKVIADHNRRLAAVREELKPIAITYPSVMLLASNQLNQNLQLENSNNSSCGSLIENLGFQIVSLPSLEKSEETTSTISLEVLPQLDADLIILQAWNRDFSSPPENLTNHQLDPVKQQWNSNAIAQSLEASKADRVYFTSAYLCRAMPGPIGAEIFLNQLRQQLLSEDAKTGES